MPSVGTDALNAAGGVVALRPAQGGRIIDIKVTVLFRRIERLFHQIVLVVVQRRAIRIMRGAQVLFHPDLLADLHGVVSVSVIVRNGIFDDDDHGLLFAAGCEQKNRYNE